MSAELTAKIPLRKGGDALFQQWALDSCKSFRKEQMGAGRFSWLSSLAWPRVGCGPAAPSDSRSSYVPGSHGACIGRGKCSA